MQGGGVRATDEAGLSHPPGAVRPAVQHLVHPGPLPAHARSAAPDGQGDLLPVVAGRPEPADHAFERADRRPGGERRADQVSGEALGPDHRAGRGRGEVPAAPPGAGEPQPGPLLGGAARGAHDFHGLGAGAGCGAPGHRRAGHQGEAIATFGDALRRLTDNATFLYVDGKRYWYSTQPTVRRTADARAGQFDEHQGEEEIRRRRGAQERQAGDFVRVHAERVVGPADVVDEPTCRLVVMPPGRTHLAKATDSPALGWPGRSWSRGAPGRGSTGMRWCSWQPTRRGWPSWSRGCASSWPGSPSSRTRRC